MKIILENGDYMLIYLGEFYGTAAVEYGKIISSINNTQVRHIDGNFNHESLVDLLKSLGVNLENYEEEVVEKIDHMQAFIKIEKNQQGVEKYSLCDMETLEEISASRSLVELMFSKVLLNENNASL